MNLRLRTFLNRRSRKIFKIVCVSLVVIGFFTVFATNYLQVSDITANEGPDDSKSPSHLKRTQHKLNELEVPEVVITDTVRPVSHYYDGSFLRGERIQSLENLIDLEISKQVPGLGDGGGAIRNDNDNDEITAILKTEAFNLILSNKIPYTRKLPNLNNPLCSTLVFSKNLPTASIVIVFTNEAWSSLMRTIFSVLNRSPPHLLKEIILVDDLSTRACLGKQLDYYVSTHLPSLVKLVRLEARSGLIKARLEGAKHASGDVLIFLDAHCETTPMWLEPLLQRILEEPNAAVTPFIDVIDDKTFEYISSNSLQRLQVGGFTWSGHFKWFTPDQSNRTNLTSPIRSPTMAGGLFGIRRQYFWDLGAYDPDMQVWGGENLEISFRIWQCGGRLEGIPCSHVGHIFRSFHPYTFPGGADTHGINTARLAEVWMDKYKDLLYLHRPDLKIASIGDLTDRKELRKNLKCKNFRWYLDNIYPEKFILNEDVKASGRVFVNTDNMKFCLDTMQREHDGAAYIVGLYSCHPVIAMSQYFSFSNNGEFRREDMCAEVSNFNIREQTGFVKMYSCHGKKGRQEWEKLPSGQLLHVETKLCMDSVTWLKYEDKVRTRKCDKDSKTQVWEWSDTLHWD